MNLSREQIRLFPPGLASDRYIAGEVLGWLVVDAYRCCRWQKRSEAHRSDAPCELIPSFTIAMAHAWPLFEQLPEPPADIVYIPPLFKVLAQMPEGGYVAGWCFNDADGHTRWYADTAGTAITAPLAICRSLLLCQKLCDKGRQGGQ